MLKRILATFIVVGVLWGVGTWLGGGKPMLTSGWFSAMHAMITSYVDGSEEVVRDKLPADGFQLDLPSPSELGESFQGVVE